MFHEVNDTQVLLKAPEGYNINFSNPQKDTTIISWIYSMSIIQVLLAFIVGPSFYTLIRKRGKRHIHSSSRLDTKKIGNTWSSSLNWYIAKEDCPESPVICPYWKRCDLEQLITQLTRSGRDCGSFVLFHSDLRPANIIVDNCLNIKCIIDWEWAYTVLRRLFMPPSWITLYDTGRTNKADRSNLFPEFHDIIETMASSSSLYRPLANEWGPDLPNNMILPLAEIRQRHSNLLHIHYKFTFPRCFSKPRQEVVAEFL
ncbi:hypothetical protein FGRA07_11813 [Fusarium graminearum]|nr:hypothetical protein FGRA07_11813 [Fusarium graminearum]